MFVKTSANSERLEHHQKKKKKLNLLVIFSVDKKITAKVRWGDRHRPTDDVVLLTERKSTCNSSTVCATKVYFKWLITQKVWGDRKPFSTFAKAQFFLETPTQHFKIYPLWQAFWKSYIFFLVEKYTILVRTEGCNRDKKKNLKKKKRVSELKQLNFDVHTKPTF